MTDEKRQELIEALEQFIAETPVRYNGQLRQWADGQPVAVTIVEALTAIAWLRRQQFELKVHRTLGEAAADDTVLREDMEHRRPAHATLDIDLENL